MKKKILVCDNKRAFLKMFKKKLCNEPEFFQTTFLCDTQDEFDFLILVVYNKFELLDFLRLYKIESNTIICVFNEKLYSNLAFLENINDLFLLNASKKRSDIIKDLKLYFRRSSYCENQLTNSQLPSPCIQKQFNESLYSLIID
ncbi:hypothetical protein CLU81_0572 [Flavobacterium sp. 9]|uniref:hypothetical protein n=1 Tax=Flavobacterium sp. 9 TaxID=2035198 RepID=UPI000C17CE9A|nr:hypothetical protein [Flavobacterium sp. 9]PIF30165.1 hypothetical protein CLU81_0572 [Flavobacterium sp. 9]